MPLSTHLLSLQRTQASWRCFATGSATASTATATFSSFQSQGVAGSAFARSYILKPRPLALRRSSILPFKLPLEGRVGNSVLPYERPV